PRRSAIRRDQRRHVPHVGERGEPPQHGLVAHTGNQLLGRLRMTGFVVRLDPAGILQLLGVSVRLLPDVADPLRADLTRPLMAAACSSTLPSSSASTSATSAMPPRAEISLATFSRVARVLPARKTRAPSRPKALATAAPIAPPAPYTTAFLLSRSTSSLRVE